MAKGAKYPIRCAQPAAFFKNLRVISLHFQRNAEKIAMMVTEKATKKATEETTEKTVEETTEKTVEETTEDTPVETSEKITESTTAGASVAFTTSADISSMETESIEGSRAAPSSATTSLDPIKLVVAIMKVRVRYSIFFLNNN
jgi:hypothetical protein